MTTMQVCSGADTSISPRGGDPYFTRASTGSMPEKGCEPHLAMRYAAESMTFGQLVLESRLRRLPAWFWLSMLTIALWGAWGIQSKLIVDRISPWMNQVLFPLGLVPVMAWMLRSRRIGE